MTDTLVVLAGLAQLGIAASSLLLPRILGWPEQTARLEPLTRCVFWTYSGYILATNTFFGVVSTLAPHWLTDGTPLARVLTGFIATYWGARVLIQAFAYRFHKPKGAFYRFAEIAYVFGFAFCALVYGAVALAMM